VLVEGDPNHPLQTILGVDVSRDMCKLDDVIKKGVDVRGAIHSTMLDNLYLIPSGVSLEGYFGIDPINFASKLAKVETDFIFIDVPFPLGKAAFLSLGVCEYFIPILTEDEFALCVESAIDTIRLGKYYFKCVPVGFVLNRIKTPERFNDKFVHDLEDLLEIHCITKIKEDNIVSSSYGGAGATKAFLAYQKQQTGDFVNEINKIALMLLGDLPRPEKSDASQFIKNLIKS
jgi:MinD-like ATPase involved in chromosome partitioning or flagellar assembly